MKDGKNLNVSFANGEAVKQLIILEGDSPKINYPVKPTISGDIFTVESYLEARKVTALSKVDTTVIVFNEANGTIILNANPADELEMVVTAKSEIYPDLEKFGINKNKFLSQTELEQLVKMNKIYFADKDENFKIITELSKFKASVQSELESARDKRSNVTQNFNKTVNAQLSASFKLKMPIIKGSADSLFLVEICYDVRDAAVSFYLESVELHELQKQAVKDAFEPQMTKFKELGFTCINQ